APESEEMALTVEFALLVARLAHAVDRGDRTVDEPHHGADGQLFRRPGEEVTPLRPALAPDEPAPLELVEDHLEEPDRDLLPLRDRRNLQRLRAAVVLRQCVD